MQKYSLAPTRREVLSRLCALTGDDCADALLDLGCGTGQLLRELAALRPKMRLYGADKSERMLTQANERQTPAQLLLRDVSREGLPPELPDKLRFVVCCHSFPYYPDKPRVLEALCGALADDGRMLFVQASINGLYDRLVLAAVEQTAERADYLSRAAFRALVSPLFNVEEEFLVRERRFMPSICGFVMGKRL